MNKLNLSNNSLSGEIPEQFSRLIRLRELSVADNDLKGPIPYVLKGYGRNAFQGNTELCGQPLGNCGGGGGGLSNKSMIIIIAAAGFGAGFSLLLVLGLSWR